MKSSLIKNDRVCVNTSCNKPIPQLHYLSQYCSQKCKKEMLHTTNQPRKVSKLYDTSGNWIGMRVTEYMTRKQYEKRYTK